jgi:hypothetical protein
MINLKSTRESTVKAGESEINRAAFPISGGPSGQSNGAKFRGQLEMGFFQQSFQLILRAHFVAGPLPPSARDGAPQALFAIGHKAEGQFIGHQPLHQPFGVGEVPLGALAQRRTLRIRQLHGLDFSIVESILPLPAFPILLDSKAFS